MYVFFPFILDIKFVRRTSRVTQEEGHTGFLIHLPFAVHALIFLARRIQPFPSLVDREVEFCVITIYSFSTRWAFLFVVFLFFSEKNPVCRDRTHVPTSEGYEVTSELSGRKKYKTVQFSKISVCGAVYKCICTVLSELKLIN